MYYLTIGSVAGWIMRREVSPKVYKMIYKFLEEGKSMVGALKKGGLNNAICMHNLKNIEFLSKKQNIGCCSCFYQE